MSISVEQEIRELEKIFPSSEYIYRGQPRNYMWQGNRVSSSLARVLARTRGAALRVLEANILIGAASFYSPHARNIEIMADLRHLRFPINLIDFTRDIRVALFFACLGNPWRSGKIFFLRFESRAPWFDEDLEQSALYDLPQAINMSFFPSFHISSNAKRAIRQSSVLVHSPSGHLDFKKEETYRIPAARKKDILEYLTRPSSSIESHYLFPDKADFTNLGLESPGPHKDFEKKLNALLTYRSEKLQGGDDYDKGRDYFFHGQYAKAIDHFRAATPNPGKIPGVNLRRFLSSALLRTEQPRKALAELAKIPGNNWDAEDHYMAAQSKRKLGIFDEAQAEIELAIDKNHFRSVYYTTAILLAKQAGDRTARLNAMLRYQNLFQCKRGEDSPLGRD